MKRRHGYVNEFLRRKPCSIFWAVAGGKGVIDRRRCSQSRISRSSWRGPIDKAHLLCPASNIASASFLEKSHRANNQSTVSLVISAWRHNARMSRWPLIRHRRPQAARHHHTEVARPLQQIGGRAVSANVERRQEWKWYASRRGCIANSSAGDNGGPAY